MLPNVAVTIKAAAGQVVRDSISRPSLAVNLGSTASQCVTQSSYFITVPGLCFCICKMGMVIVPPSQVVVRIK